MAGFVTINGTADWVSLNSLTGIAIGDAFEIQNSGNAWFLLRESVSKPDVSDFGGVKVTTLFQTEPTRIIDVDSSEIWIRGVNPDATLKINCQEI